LFSNGAQVRENPRIHPAPDQRNLGSIKRDCQNGLLPTDTHVSFTFLMFSIGISDTEPAPES
jgi:hypothetical protein